MPNHKLNQTRLPLLQRKWAASCCVARKLKGAEKLLLWCRISISASQMPKSRTLPAGHARPVAAEAQCEGVRSNSKVIMPQKSVRISKALDSASLVFERWWVIF